MGGRGSGDNPNSQKNLQPPAKGSKANALARRAILLSKAYKAKLAEEDPKNPGKTFAEVIASTMVELAAYSKSIKAATEIADRVEGRPAQSVNLDGTLTHQTTTERVQHILEALSILKDDDGSAESSDQRIM